MTEGWAASSPARRHRVGHFEPPRGAPLRGPRPHRLRGASERAGRTAAPAVIAPRINGQHQDCAIDEAIDWAALVANACRRGLAGRHVNAAALLLAAPVCSSARLCVRVCVCVQGSWCPSRSYGAAGTAPVPRPARSQAT